MWYREGHGIVIENLQIEGPVGRTHVGDGNFATLGALKEQRNAPSTA